MKIRLTEAMEDALVCLCAKPLTQQRHGWANNPLFGHATATVRALITRGLATSDNAALRNATITATGLGRRVRKSIGETAA